MKQKGRMLFICPNCGKTLDGHMTSEGKMDDPSKGDICICVGCHSILKCEGAHKLKKITIEDVKNKELKETIMVALNMFYNRHT